MVLARNGFAGLPEQIDAHLTAYLVRNTSIGLDQVDRRSLARLRRLADAVSKIIEAENGST